MKMPRRQTEILEVHLETLKTLQVPPPELLVH